MSTDDPKFIYTRFVNITVFALTESVFFQHINE